MQFDNLKMRTRLALGYGVVLFMLAAVALAGYLGMSRSDAALHHIADVNIKKISLLNNMATSVHVVSRVVRTIALLHDDKEADLQRLKIVDRGLWTHQTLGSLLNNVAYLGLREMNRKNKNAEPKSIEVKVG